MSTSGCRVLGDDDVAGATLPRTLAERSWKRQTSSTSFCSKLTLTGPVTVIGRGSEADIIVDDPGVSRRHLEIRVGPDGVVASDLGSTNGLYVEGHQVPAATLLDGNTLTIGRTRIMFWTGASDDRDE